MNTRPSQAGLGPLSIALTALLTLGAPRPLHAQAALEPVELSDAPLRDSISLFGCGG